MRASWWIAIGVALAVGAVLALRGSNELGSEPPSADGAVVAAGVTATAPSRRMATPAQDRSEVEDEDGSEPAAIEPESSLQRELSEPERREAEAYPWDEFEDILGRSLTTAERDGMRDLRKEHGLRLAEARARVARGDMPRAEFDAWRAERAQGFRAELARALGASAEEVHTMLQVPMRSP